MGLREAKEKILESMKPMITKEIKDMYLAISVEKAAGFNNKSRVFFILAQKNHYMALLDKLQDYFIKINQIINKLRRHDKIPAKEVFYDNTQVEQMACSKDSITKLLSNIEKDLPCKSWKVVLQKPESKLYQMVVMKAMGEEKVVREYQELEKQEFEGEGDGVMNSSMLVSSTRRVGSPQGKDPMDEMRNGMNQSAQSVGIGNNSNSANTNSSTQNSYKLQTSPSNDENILLMKKNSN